MHLEVGVTVFLFGKCIALRFVGKPQMHALSLRIQTGTRMDHTAPW